MSSVLCESRLEFFEVAPQKGNESFKPYNAPESVNDGSLNRARIGTLTTPKPSTQSLLSSSREELTNVEGDVTEKDKGGKFTGFLPAAQQNVLLEHKVQNPRVFSVALSEPHYKSTFTDLNGADMGDIPARYSIPRLRPHELPVIGFYVDKNVLPGFAYTVRLNESDETLFGGRPLTLKSIGCGYGKRITFASEDLLENDNYFWSDSNAGLGFAFSIHVISTGSKFSAWDPSHRQVAWLHVTSVDNDQSVVSAKLQPTGEVLVEVAVNLSCDFHFLDAEYISESLRGRKVKLQVSGLALAEKNKEASRGIVCHVLNPKISGIVGSQIKIDKLKCV